MRKFLVLVISILLYTKPSFSNPSDYPFTISNDTDSDYFSIQVIIKSQRYKYKYCISPATPLAPHNSTNFTLIDYDTYCRQPAFDKSGKRITDSSGRNLFYAQCYFQLYASNYCTGSPVASLIFQRTNYYGNHYTTDEAPVNLQDWSMLAGDIQDSELNNTELKSGYRVQKSGVGGRELHIQTTTYYMLHNKSRTFATIAIDSKCQIEKKIDDVRVVDILAPGDSIWVISNWLLHSECKSKDSCAINLYEVSKPSGSKGTCGNLIAKVVVDIQKGVKEIINADPNKHTVSIESYRDVPLSIRQSLLIK